MAPQRVPVARILVAAPNAGDALQLARLGQFEEVAAAPVKAALPGFLPSLHGDGQLIELNAVVGMEWTLRV